MFMRYPTYVVAGTNPGAPDSHKQFSFRVSSRNLEEFVSTLIFNGCDFTVTRESDHVHGITQTISQEGLFDGDDGEALASG